MKKYWLILCSLLVAFNANAAGVVLSDTSEEEETFYAPRNTNQSSGDFLTDILATDSSDPLFFVADNTFLSDTSVSYMDSRMLLGQYIGYGINQNLAFHANIYYQIDFTHHRENGFSATEFGATYRMNHGTGASRIISDALFGLKAWGSSHVRTPEYANSSYYAGLRFGRQYTVVTLAGTVKSTWVFDDTRGLSYIDFMPDLYFRLQYDWRAGIGADFRRSTNERLLPNQEWIDLRLVRQFGNTQYVGHFDYEFEAEEVKVGFDVKILF